MGNFASDWSCLLSPCADVLLFLLWYEGPHTVWLMCLMRYMHTSFNMALVSRPCVLLQCLLSFQVSCTWIIVFAGRHILPFRISIAVRSDKRISAPQTFKNKYSGSPVRWRTQRLQPLMNGIVYNAHLNISTMLGICSNQWISPRNIDWRCLRYFKPLMNLSLPVIN